MNTKYFKVSKKPQFDDPVWKYRDEQGYEVEGYPDNIWLSDTLVYLIDANPEIISTIDYYERYRQSKDFPKLTNHIILEIFESIYPILGTPDFFEVYVYKDMQHGLDIVLTNTRGPSSVYPALPIVQTKLIQDFIELGFKGYRTYPVRVYYIDKYEDQFVESRDRDWIRGRPTQAEAEQRFEYDDTRYVLLQLTQPPLEFFEVPQRPEDRVLHSNSLEFRDDFDTLEFPIFFRVKYQINEFFCNAKAKEVLQKYKSLRFLDGADFHRAAKGGEKFLTQEN